MRYKGNNDIYVLEDQPMKAGGEGAIYSIQSHPDMVAKIYHQGKLSYELEEKIIYMRNNPPESSILNQIAWPLDVIRDGMGSFVGFVMPRLSIDTDLKAIYSYPPNPQIPITYEQKVIVAINIAVVISTIHKAGYVFGDFNPLNIGVNLKTGHVAFLDTDSYHITNQTSGKVYRCEVCLDGYVAPELIQKCKGTDFASAPLPTFTQETDRFALAIHIFKLLMNGYTPFNGIKEGESASQASPGVGNLAIERDNYCFKPGNKPQSVATPDISAVSPDIQYLFKKTFLGGATAPGQRATADEWYHALREYKDNLTRCKNNPNHYYYVNNGTCPYCDADTRYNNSMASFASSSSAGNIGGQQNQMNFGAPVNIPLRPRRQNNKPTQKSLRTRVLLWIFLFPVMLCITIGKSKMGLIWKILLIYTVAQMTLSALGTGAAMISAFVEYGASDIGSSSATTITVDVEKLTDQLITGYNNYGYFDGEKDASDNVTVKGKQYTLTLKNEKFEDGYRYLTLLIDTKTKAIGNAVIRAKSDEYLSNDAVLEFEIYQEVGNGHDLYLKNNIIRITTLNTNEVIRDDPRDHFEIVFSHEETNGWWDYQWSKFKLLDTSYSVGDKVVKLSVIEDKRPGAKEVQPGLLFEIYDKDDNLLASGSYKFTGMKYSSNYDDYGNNSGAAFYFVPYFDQSELVGKTGILFINTEYKYDFCY